MAKGKGITTTEPMEGHGLPADLMHAQAQSSTIEREPKPVPLVRVKEPDGKGFVDQPPVPPRAASNPLPRFIHQNERAPEGTRRFKIRCTNYGEQPTRYLLASSELEAREHYLRATGLQSVLDKLRSLGVERIENPNLAVTALKD